LINKIIHDSKTIKFSNYTAASNLQQEIVKHYKHTLLFISKKYKIHNFLIAHLKRIFTHATYTF